MADIVTLQPQETLEESASLWVARLDRGLSSKEERAFQRWLNQSDAHLTTVTAMAEMWGELNALSVLQKHTAPGGVESGVENQPVPSEATPKWALGRRLKRSWYLPSAIAACFVLAAVMMLPSYDGESPQNVQYSAVYTTNEGEFVNVDLPDRSALYVNTGSQVEVKFSREARHIILQKGELFVDVAHNPQRPLIVTAGEKSFRAVGTAFSVRADDLAPLTLVVTDGLVNIEPAIPSDAPITSGEFPPASGNLVTQGQRATISGGGIHIKSANSFELRQNVAWKEQSLIFHEDPLEKVLNEVARYTPVNFELTDEALKDIPVIGVFSTGDTQSLLTVLKENFHIQARWVSENTVELYGMPEG